MKLVRGGTSDIHNAHILWDFHHLYLRFVLWELKTRAGWRCMYFHQMNPQQQFQWNWMFWFRALVKFQMLFEIESRLQRRQQNKTLTCYFRPKSENVDGPEWYLGSQAINLLKVFIFSFLPLVTRLFQICRHWYFFFEIYGFTLNIFIIFQYLLFQNFMRIF